MFVDAGTYTIPGLINIGVTLTMCALGVRKYNRDRKTDESERQKIREANIERDTTRHIENKTKMDMIIEFQRDQLMVNRSVTEQLQQFRECTAELKTQTALLQVQTKDITDKLWRLGPGQRRGEEGSRS